MELTESGTVLAENLIKFRNYLMDFSLMNERGSFDVHIWDKLMLYAALIGATEAVKSEFDKIYPEYFGITEIDYGTIYLANRYSVAVSRSYMMTSLSELSSSGSGGGTGFGGGGGSFGGGSGGGTR